MHREHSCFLEHLGQTKIFLKFLSDGRNGGNDPLKRFKISMVFRIYHSHSKVLLMLLAVNY